MIQKFPVFQKTKISRISNFSENGIFQFFRKPKFSDFQKTKISRFPDFQKMEFSEFPDFQKIENYLIIN